MPDTIKVRDDKTGKTYQIQYDGAPPTNDEIADILDQKARQSTPKVASPKPAAPKPQGNGLPSGMSFKWQKPDAVFGASKPAPSTTAPSPAPVDRMRRGDTPAILRAQDKNRPTFSKKPFAKNLQDVVGQGAESLLMIPSAAMNRAIGDTPQAVREVRAGLRPQGAIAAGTRAAARSTAPSLAGLAGAGAAMEASAPLAAMMPNPFLKAGVPAVAGALGAVGAGGVVNSAQDSLLKALLGGEGYGLLQEQQSRDAQQHPLATRIGGLVPQMATMSANPFTPGLRQALQGASPREAAKLVGSDVAARVGGAAVPTAINAIIAKAQGQPLDMGQTIEDMALFTAFPNQNRFGRGVIGAGHGAADRVMNSPIFKPSRTLAGRVEIPKTAVQSTQTGEQNGTITTGVRPGLNDGTEARGAGPSSTPTAGDTGQAPSVLRAGGSGSGAAQVAPPDATSPNFPGLRNELIAPEEIGLLPGMQYKRGIDKNGVTDLLKGQKDYEVEHGGTLTAFRDENGNLLAVDGHHRRELAQRAERFTAPAADGSRVEVPRKLPVQVLDAADGWTAESAKIFGVLKNLRENKGVAIDAADALTASLTPEQSRAEAQKLPKTPLARDVSGLVLLDEAGRTSVRNKQISEPVGAAIGEVLRGDVQRQRIAIEQAMNTNGIRSYDDGTALARAVKDEEIVLKQNEGGPSLFGDDDSIGGARFTSTAGEQAIITQSVKRRLQSEQSSLLSVEKTQAREGEAFDLQGRRDEASQVQSARSKIDALLEFDPEVKTVLRQAAADVMNGKIGRDEGIAKVREVLLKNGSASLAEIVKKGNAAQPVPDQSGGGLFDEPADVPPPYVSKKQATEQPTAPETAPLPDVPPPYKPSRPVKPQSLPAEPRPAPEPPTTPEAPTQAAEAPASPVVDKAPSPLTHAAQEAMAKAIGYDLPDKVSQSHGDVMQRAIANRDTLENHINGMAEGDTLPSIEHRAIAGLMQQEAQSRHAELLKSGADNAAIDESVSRLAKLGRIVYDAGSESGVNLNFQKSLLMGEFDPGREIAHAEKRAGGNLSPAARREITRLALEGQETKAKIDAARDAKAEAEVEEFKASVPPKRRRIAKPADPNYGADNTVFSREKYEAAVAKWKEANNPTRRGAALTVDFSPELAQAVLDIGGFHFEAGLRKFADWANQVRQDVGDVPDDVLTEAWGKVSANAALKEAEANAGRMTDAQLKAKTDTKLGEMVATGKPSRFKPRPQNPLISTATAEYAKGARSLDAWAKAMEKRIGTALPEQTKQELFKDAVKQYMTEQKDVLKIREELNRRIDEEVTATQHPLIQRAKAGNALARKMLSFKATFDASFFGRQGGKIITARPDIGAKALVQFGPRRLADKKSMAQFAEDIDADIKAAAGIYGGDEHFKEIGLDFTGKGGEEGTSGVNLDGPVWSTLKKLGIDASEEGNRGILNYLRLEYFKTLAKPTDSLEYQKRMAALVNIMASRGEIRNQKLRSFLTTMADLGVWSPRANIANVQWNTGADLAGTVADAMMLSRVDPQFAYKQSEYRRALARQLGERARFAVTYTTALAMLKALSESPAGKAAKMKVEMNPLSKDIGKVKLGEVEYDTLSGSRKHWAKGMELLGVTQPSAFEENPKEKSWQSVNGNNAAVSYGRSMLNPLAGGLIDLVYGADFAGKPVKVMGLQDGKPFFDSKQAAWQAAEAVTPMFIGAWLDAVKENTMSPEMAQSILMTMPFDYFGVGSTIRQRSKEPAQREKAKRDKAGFVPLRYVPAYLSTGGK